MYTERCGGAKFCAATGMCCKKGWACPYTSIEV